MKVLVLDDNYQDLAPMFRHCFREDEFVFVATPAAAEKVLGQNTFDVLLLDGNLGNGVTGPDVLRRWKSKGLGLPPVHMISGDPEMNKEGLEAGAAGAIDKIDIGEGFEALRKK